MLQLRNKCTHPFHKHTQSLLTVVYRYTKTVQLASHLQSFLHFFLGFGIFLPKDVDSCILVEDHLPRRALRTKRRESERVGPPKGVREVVRKRKQGRGGREGERRIEGGREEGRGKGRKKRRHKGGDRQRRETDRDNSVGVYE